MWDWEFAVQITPDLLRAFLVTIQATMLGMSLALFLGLVWAILRRAHHRILCVPSFWFVEFIRSTPLLVQIYFLFFVLPDFGIRLSPLTTGVLALGLHYSAYTAEVYRAGIEGVPKGQWEAAIALNMKPWRIWHAVILPQALPPVIPAMGNYLVAMFKDTPMLAAITVLELLQTAKLIGAESFRYLEPLTLVGLLFLAISLLSSRLIHTLETRFASR
jgi:polar amino acid transport system permease protein